MAVKVMVAPSILTGELHKQQRKPRAAIAPEAAQAAVAAPQAAQPAKLKRRRSSVYDADGNEVFITLMCLKCHKTRPLSQFGLRKMADGAIRNQPWCRPCRSSAGAEKGPAAAEESPVAAEPVATAEPSVAPGPMPAPVEAAAQPVSPPSQSAGAVAAQIAAALAAGSGS